MRTWISEELKAAVETNLDHARRLAVRVEVQPVAFIFMTGPDGAPGILIIGAEAFDVSEKDEFSEVIRSMASVTGADAVMFVCEAWAVMGDDGDDEELRRVAQMSDLHEHPGRFEVVQAVVETVDGESTMYMARISGSFPEREITEFEVMTLAEVDGRFSNFFSHTKDMNLFRELVSPLDDGAPSLDDE